MAIDSLPLRKIDMLFVLAVVMLALAVPSTAIAVAIVTGAVLAWIRFRVFGAGNRANDRP
jgi:hypothetical protein